MSVSIMVVDAEQKIGDAPNSLGIGSSWFWASSVHLSHGYGSMFPTGSNKHFAPLFGCHWPFTIHSDCNSFRGDKKPQVSSNVARTIAYGCFSLGESSKKGLIFQLAMFNDTRPIHPFPNPLPWHKVLSYGPTKHADKDAGTHRSIFVHIPK